eukprot:gene11099-7725_t
MPSEEPLCDMNDTWEEITDEFKNALKACATWKCFSVEGVDKEGILSAAEIMDPQTDTGFGYQDIYSLEHLFETKEVPHPSSFADENSLVELMDYLHIRELHYLNGFSLVQSYLAFPYFLDIDRLKEPNPVMYTYCRAMLRTLESVLRATFATTIRGDEEFMAAPPEVDKYMNIPLDEVLAELEALATTSSPAIAIRLRWRKNFVQALSLFQEATSRPEVEKACQLCTEACEWLEKAPELQRTSEPTVDPKLIRDKEVPYWVSVITPTKSLEQPVFTEAMSAYSKLLTQLASLQALFKLPTLNSITQFVEDLGAQSPLLLVRCVAVVTLFSRDPNESFLFGLPLHQRLLETLAKVYGAPLYLKVFEENSSVIESVVQYRIHKTMDPTKVSREQVETFRQQTIEAMRHWTSEACKNYLIHLETMLCNRGLAHRRLMNAVPGLANFQELSYYTDLNIFMFRVSGGQKSQEEASRISMVLTLWANTLVLHTMELIIKFQMELDLLKPGERIPALWYLSTIHHTENDNMKLLALSKAPSIPENRINKKRAPLYNLCLSTRTASQLDVSEWMLMEVHRQLADVQLVAACIAEKKGLVDFSGTGSASLITAENIFNQRYFKCFRSIQSPAFAPYRHCMESKPIIKDEDVAARAENASSVAMAAANQIRSYLQQPSAYLWDSRRRMLEKMERSARGLAASLFIMADASTTAEAYECTLSTPGLPHYLSFNFKKKSLPVLAHQAFSNLSSRLFHALRLAPQRNFFFLFLTETDVSQSFAFVPAQLKERERERERMKYTNAYHKPLLHTHTHTKHWRNIGYTPAFLLLSTRTVTRYLHGHGEEPHHTPRTRAAISSGKISTTTTRTVNRLPSPETRRGHQRAHGRPFKPPALVHRSRIQIETYYVPGPAPALAMSSTRVGAFSTYFCLGVFTGCLASSRHFAWLCKTQSHALQLRYAVLESYADECEGMERTLSAKGVHIAHLNKDNKEYSFARFLPFEEKTTTTTTTTTTTLYNMTGMVFLPEQDRPLLLISDASYSLFSSMAAGEVQSLALMLSSSSSSSSSSPPPPTCPICPFVWTGTGTRYALTYLSRASLFFSPIIITDELISISFKGEIFIITTIIIIIAPSSPFTLRLRFILFFVSSPPWSVGGVARHYFAMDLSVAGNAPPDSTLHHVSTPAPAPLERRVTSFSTAGHSNEGSRSTSPMKYFSSSSPPQSGAATSRRHLQYFASSSGGKHSHKRGGDVSPLLVSPSARSTASTPLPASAPPLQDAADLATATFVSSLLLPPPLHQFYADERTLSITAGIRLMQQRTGTDAAAHGPNPALTTTEGSPFPRGPSPGRGGGGSSTTSPQEDESVGGTSSSPPLPLALGVTTLNTFVLHSQAKLTPEAAAQALCPTVAPLPQEPDNHAAYYRIINFFTRRYGPFANLEQLKRPAAAADGQPGPTSAACGYGYWERYVAYFPDVYANFPQAPVFCLMSFYAQLPRGVQKGLDTLAALVHEAQHAAGTEPGDGERGPRAAARPARSSVLASSAAGFLHPTAAQQTPGADRWESVGTPEAAAGAGAVDDNLNPVTPTTQLGVPSEFFFPSPLGDAAMGPTLAAPEEFAGPALQLAGTTGVYDEVAGLINALIQRGDRHVALHVILATCRYRPLDRLLAAFQHVLATLPSIRMTTVALAMEAWRILHSITQRSTEYMMVAKTLVQTLTQYLSHHGDMASLMTGLVGLRHVLSWESYTYRSLVLDNLEELLLGVWAVLYQDGVSGAATGGAAPHIGELAAAVLRILFCLALNQRRFVLVQNCVAHAANCMAATSSTTSADGSGPSGAPWHMTSTSECGEKLSDLLRGSANTTVQSASFDMSFSALGGSHPRGGGGARHLAFSPGVAATDSSGRPFESNANETDFGAEVVRLGTVGRYEDGVAAGALVIGAFLSAWQCSPFATAAAGPSPSPPPPGPAAPEHRRPRSPVMNSSAAAPGPSGLPLPLLEEEERGSSPPHTMSHSSISALRGAGATRRGGPFDPEWSYLTAEKVNELIPPLNISTSLFLRPDSGADRQEHSSADTFKTKLMADGLKAGSGPGPSPTEDEAPIPHSGRPPRPNTEREFPDSRTRLPVRLDYFLPVEVVSILVGLALPRSAVDDTTDEHPLPDSPGMCAKTTPLSCGGLPALPAAPALSDASVAALERLLPLLVRAYGSRLPQPLLARAVLEVTNRAVRDLKAKGRGPSPRRQSLYSLHCEAENAEVEPPSALPSLLNAAALLCAVGPIHPRLFEVLLLTKFSECFAFALHYRSPAYTPSALPALGFIAHNIPPTCNPRRVVPLLDRLLHVAMSAPFSMLQATVTASIAGVFPTLGRSVEHALLWGIAQALESPDTAAAQESSEPPTAATSGAWGQRSIPLPHPSRSDEGAGAGRRSLRLAPLAGTTAAEEQRADDEWAGGGQPFRPLSLCQDGALPTPSFAFPAGSTPIMAGVQPSGTPTFFPTTRSAPLPPTSDVTAHVVAKKKLCFQILQMLRCCWKFTAGFCMEHCLPYVRHPDAQLRLLAVTCCADLLLQDCYHEGRRPALLLTGSADSFVPRPFQALLCTNSHAAGAVAVTRKKPAGLRASGLDAAGRPPTPEGFLHSVVHSAESREADTSAVPSSGSCAENALGNACCDVHRGRTHINTIREVVQRLVDVAVCDPDAHVRLAALHALRPSLSQFLSPHPDVIEALFVVLNDVSLRNRTEAVRVLGALAPHNPAAIYPRLRTVFLRKLEHFVQCRGPTSEEELKVQGRPTGPSQQAARGGDGGAGRTGESGSPDGPMARGGSPRPGKLAEPQPPAPAPDTSLDLMDEDLSLLIEISGTLIASSTLYLSHLLSMLRRVLRYSASHTRSTVINVLHLLRQLHDDSAAEDWPLFEPFLAIVPRQLMLRDGDTERLLATVAALQSLYQSRVAAYAVAPGNADQQLTVRWLHSLNYQKPSIGPSLSVAILKLLGTISSKETSLGPEYNHQLPLLLQRPRDRYEVPRLSAVADVSSVHDGAALTVFVPQEPKEAVALGTAPHVLRPFSPSLWPDAVLRVLLHSLLDHINYTTTLTPEGIKDCLDTILEIMCETGARFRAAAHLPSFLSIFLHLAYHVPEGHHRLPIIVAAKVLQKISAVVIAAGRSIGPLFPLLHSLLLHEWSSGRRVRLLCCCRMLETLTKMWVNELMVVLSSGQSTTERDGTEILQLHLQDGREELEDTNIDLSRLFDTEPMKAGDARVYGLAILYLTVCRTILAFLPLVPPRVGTMLCHRLPHLLVGSGVLYAATSGEPGKSVYTHTVSPTVSSSETTDSVEKFPKEVRLRREDIDGDTSLSRAHTVLVNPLLYDQIDLMGITRERLGAAMNRSITHVLMAYAIATSRVDSFAATVMEQCLQRLGMLAECHKNALQRAASIHRANQISPCAASSTTDAREDDERTLLLARQAAGNKERMREGLWHEQSPLLQLVYASRSSEILRGFPFECLNSSWETYAEMDLLACVFTCFSLGGEPVQSYRHHIAAYILSRFGEGSVVAAFFRCATLPTYHLRVRGSGPIPLANKTATAGKSSRAWGTSSDAPLSELVLLTQAQEAVKGLGAQKMDRRGGLLNPSLLAAAPDRVLSEGTEGDDAGPAPPFSLSHAASAETLNFDESAPLSFRRATLRRSLPRSAPVPIAAPDVGYSRLYTSISTWQQATSPVEDDSSFHDFTQRHPSPPSSSRTDLPEAEATGTGMRDSQDVSMPSLSTDHLALPPAQAPDPVPDADGEEGDTGDINAGRRDSMMAGVAAAPPAGSVLSTPNIGFLQGVPPLIQDSKFFDRTIGSWQDASRTPLLDHFEKHTFIGNGNMRDWKPWFEHFCFQLIDHCHERSVELCAPLIKTHKFSILYSDILGIAFMANLESFTELQLSAFLKAFRAFYAVDREVPYSVAAELLRLSHFLRLFGPAVFSAKVFRNIVDVEISSAFLVLAAQRALNPTLMMLYLETEMRHRLRWETINACATAYDDILVPFFHHAYFILDPRLKQFLASEDPALFEFLHEESARVCPNVLWSNADNHHGCIGAESVQRSAIAAHLDSIPVFVRALQESDANPTFLAVLGWVRGGVDQMLAPHQYLLDAPRGHSDVPSSAQSVCTAGEGGTRAVFTLPVQAPTSFSSFIFAVQQAMRSYKWVYDFESILALWQQVRELLALLPRTTASSTRVFLNSASRATNNRPRSEQDLEAHGAASHSPSHGGGDESSAAGNAARTYVFSGDPSGCPPKPEDLQNSVAVLRYAAASAMALSQWDTTLEIASLAGRIAGLLHEEMPQEPATASPASLDGHMSAFLCSIPWAPKGPGADTVYRPSAAVRLSEGLEGGREFTAPILVQMEIDRAAALVATSRVAEARQVLSRVRSLLLEETAYSVFRTEHPRAKLELNCMYQQISDLEEGIHSLEGSTVPGHCPGIAEEQRDRRLRNIAFRPLTPNTSTLQRFRVLAARSSMVPTSWQVRNIFMLSEQIHQQGMPMRAVLTMKHFQTLVAGEKPDPTVEVNAERELVVERYRILLNSLNKAEDLRRLQAAVVSALRRDFAERRQGRQGASAFSSGAFSEDGAEVRLRAASTTGTAAPPFSLHALGALSTVELSTSMTSYQSNLLLISLSCARRIAEEDAAEEDAADASSRSPSQAAPGANANGSATSPLMRPSKTKCSVASPPLMASEVTQTWSSVDFSTFRLPPQQHSPLNDPTRQSSQGSFRRHFSPDLAEGVAAANLSGQSPEMLLINEYRLLEHTITYSIAAMASVWSEFGLVLFDVCIAMHEEYRRTQEPETLHNFHEQSKKAISALQQASRLWRQQSHHQEGGIGTFSTTTHPRRRHARTALPATHLVVKALYLAILCEESPAGAGAAEGGKADLPGGFTDLDFTPAMYVYWATIQSFLLHAATRHIAIYRRVKEMCANSLNMTYQFLPLLIATFEHSHGCPLRRHVQSSAAAAEDPAVAQPAPSLSYSSDMLLSLAQVGPEHAKAVQETFRMCNFGAAGSLPSPELYLDGNCRLPLPIWLLPLYSSVELDSATSSGGSAGNRRKGPMPAAAASLNASVFASWQPRGILCASRKAQLFPRASGVTSRAEDVVRLLMTDGTEMQFHRALRTKSRGDNGIRAVSLGPDVLPRARSGSGAADTDRDGAPSPTGLAKQGAGAGAKLQGLPGIRPRRRLSPVGVGGSATSSVDGHYISPHTLMELSINLLLAHLPLSYFRCPFVFPLDTQSFLTQLPEKPSRTNSWQSTFLPSSLRQTSWAGTSVSLNSIWHIQMSYEALQQRNDVVQAGLRATRGVSQPASHAGQDSPPCEADRGSSEMPSDHRLKHSSTLTRHSSCNRQEYFRLVADAFDRGDPSQLLGFLERLLYTPCEGDPTRRQLRSYDHPLDKYSFEVRLPRPLELLCQMYKQLRAVVPSSGPNDTVSTTSASSEGRRGGGSRNAESAARWSLQDEKVPPEDSSQSLVTPLLNQETQADLRHPSMLISAFQSRRDTPTPDDDSADAAPYLAAAGLRRRPEVNPRVATEVRRVLFRAESARYRDGIQAAFDAEAGYPSHWMEARRLFTQELAEWSLVQYLLDITERDSCSFFINPIGGHVATHQLGRFALQGPKTEPGVHGLSDNSVSASGASAAPADPADSPRSPASAEGSRGAAGAGIVRLLASPFPTRDPSLFRLTKSLEKILWGESAMATFLGYLAEGLYAVHLYRREIAGVSLYGLDALTATAWRLEAPRPPSASSPYERSAAEVDLGDSSASTVGDTAAVGDAKERTSSSLGWVERLLEEDAGRPTARPVTPGPCTGPRCFDCSSLREKLHFSAPLSRSGDTEPANRRSALAHLATESAENEAAIAAHLQRAGLDLARTSTEDQHSSMAFSELERSAGFSEDRSASGGSKSLRLQPDMRQALSTTTAYDVASLLISIAREESRLIGYKQSPIAVYVSTRRIFVRYLHPHKPFPLLFLAIVYSIAAAPQNIKNDRSPLSSHPAGYAIRLSPPAQTLALFGGPLHVSQRSVRRMVRQLHGHIAEQRQSVMDCRNHAAALTAAGIAFHAKSPGAELEKKNVCFVEVATEKDVKHNFIPNGALSGVAIAVSDALDVQEFHTRSGLDTPMFHHNARKEFPLISWLRRQGAQFVGKLSCRTPLAINEGCVFGKEKPASIAVANRCCHYCISCSLNGPASIACAVAHDITGFKPTAQTFGTFTEQFKLSMPSMTLGIAARRVDDLLYLWHVYTAAINPEEYFENPEQAKDADLYPQPKPQEREKTKYARPEMIDHSPSNYTIKDRRGRISDIDVGWRDYNAETAAANDFGNTPRPGFFDRVVRGKKAKYDTPQVELTVGYPAEWIDKYASKMYGTSREFHKKIADTAHQRSAFHKNQRLEVVPLAFDFDIEDVLHALNVISHYELANAFESLFVNSTEAKEKAKEMKPGESGEPDVPVVQSSDTESPAALNRPNTFQAMSGVLEELPKEIVASIYKGQSLKLSDYHNAMRLRDDVVRATEDQFHDVDSIVVPLLAEPYTPGNMRSVALTLPFHLAGNPILSVQVEKDMPVALVGELGRDAALLEDSFCFLQFVRGASPTWWRQKIQKTKTFAPQFDGHFSDQQRAGVVVAGLHTPGSIQRPVRENVSGLFWGPLGCHLLASICLVRRLLPAVRGTLRLLMCRCVRRSSPHMFLLSCLYLVYVGSNIYCCTHAHYLLFHPLHLSATAHSPIWWNLLEQGIRLRHPFCPNTNSTHTKKGRKILAGVLMRYDICLRTSLLFGFRSCLAAGTHSILDFLSFFISVHYFILLWIFAWLLHHPPPRSRRRTAADFLLQTF